MRERERETETWREIKGPIKLPKLLCCIFEVHDTVSISEVLHHKIGND